MSGAPCFYKTRLPVDSLFENLEDGVSLDEYIDGFGISREQAVAVLEYAKAKALESLQKILRLDSTKAAEWMASVREARR